MAVENREVKSKIDNLKNNLIPKFKEIFKSFTEIYSQRQIINSSYPKPDLTTYCDLMKKVSSSTQIVAFINQRLAEQIEKVKLSIIVKNEENLRFEEKLTELEDEKMNLNHLKRILEEDNNSFFAEIQDRILKKKEITNKIQEDTRVLNLLLKNNLINSSKKEKTLMSEQDNFSKYQNDLKSLKQLRFHKQIDLYQKTEEIKSINNQITSLRTEKQVLESSYENKKNESIEVELSIEYAQRSIEMYEKQQESLRKAQEKYLSECSDKAIKIEKMKDSEVWKMKEECKNVYKKECEEHHKIVACVGNQMIARKQKIFEIVYEKYRVVKAFHKLEIFAKIKKYFDDLMEENKTQLVIFTDTKQMEKEEKIAHWQAMNNKSKKNEKKRSIRKSTRNSERRESIKVQIEVEKEKDDFKEPGKCERIEVENIMNEAKPLVNFESEKEVNNEKESKIKDTKTENIKGKKNKNEVIDKPNQNFPNLTQPALQNPSKSIPYTKEPKEPEKTEEIIFAINQVKQSNYSTRKKPMRNYIPEFGSGYFN